MPKSKKKKESGKLELEQQKLANQALQDDLKIRMQAYYILFIPAALRNVSSLNSEPNPINIKPI